MKKVCIKYLVQVPLCAEHHLLRHFSTRLTKYERKQMDICMCDALNLDYYKALQAVLDKRNRGYLEIGLEKRKEIIRGWEV
jgi:hypothetical protein